MPFIRFSRDKRGYESTYLFHTYRRKESSHTRLLYWFRTPPSVRVGRHSFDPEAIRSIEESNPDLSFNWSKLFAVPLETPAKGANQVRKSQSSKKVRRSAKVEQVNKKLAETKNITGETEKLVPVVDSVEIFDSSKGGQQSDLPSESYSGLADDAEVVVEDWTHPVVTLLGDEMLGRLRARHAEIEVRISEKNQFGKLDPVIREHAEAINPNNWTTIEQAVRGIENFESEIETVKKLLGRRRARPRSTDV
mgnify:CR=1 FL=1